MAKIALNRSAKSAGKPPAERSPSEIVSSIRNKADSVQIAAASLSENLESVVEALGAIPGRVETFTWIRDPEDLDYHTEFGIRFHRKGRKWILSYGWYRHGFEEEGIDWHDLSEASLQIRMTIVDMLPDLLLRMETAQDELVKKLADASLRADDFLKSLEARSEEAGK